MSGMRPVEAEAMADPVFRTRRRRWIERFRHVTRHRGSRIDCEWCMGHAISGTILRSRGDGATILLSFDGLDLSFDSRDPHFWTLFELHRRAVSRS